MPNAVNFLHFTPWVVRSNMATKNFQEDFFGTFFQAGEIKHDKKLVGENDFRPPYTKKKWLLAFEPLQPCGSVCLLFNWKALVAAMYWHPTDQHVNEQVSWRFTFENNIHMEGNMDIEPQNGSRIQYQL